MSVQILHCSDMHLDRNFNMANLARVQERKEDLNRNFSVAVDYALSNKPDLFLVAGDVFDRVSPGNAARVFLTGKIRQLKETGMHVYMIGGNHDIPKLGGQRVAIEVLSSAGLSTVFSESDEFGTSILELNGKRVCVAGKSYFSQVESANPLHERKVPIEGDYNILMIHGSLQGLNVASSVPEMASQNPFRPEDVKVGLNYFALGHFHNFFEREYGGCKIVNSGSVEKLSYAEMNDEKGFVWAELNPDNVSTEFIKLQTRPMEEYVLQFSKDAQYTPSLKGYVIDQLQKHGNPTKIARLRLQGLISQEQYKELKINELIEATRDVFFHLGIDRRELEVEGFGKVFIGRVDNPIEAFTKRLDLLIARTDASDERHRELEQVKELGRKYLQDAQA